MKKVFSWILTPPYLIFFYLILIVFHPIQMIARRISYQAHKRTVDIMSACLLYSLKLLGTRIKINKLPYQLPANRPLIIVSNHQSMYDIPLIAVAFQYHHPKYVAKKELAHGTPSVSYNLRHGGSVTIDRSEPRQSIRAVEAFGKYIEENNYAACIFPEGSRARDGMMKSFKLGGFIKLFETAPSALIVPVAIEGSWELVKHGLLPMPVGVSIKFTVLEPLERNGDTGAEVLLKAEQSIRSYIGQPNISASTKTA
jgi:1-acyl-sn-glycerol-3-phosphate acyltransferase